MNILDTAIDLSNVPYEKWRTDYIGDGYRNCSSFRTRDGKTQIFLFGYDKNNNPQLFICPHRPRIKFNVNYKTDELDIYDNYVETRSFDNTSKRSQYVETIKDSVKIIQCDRPEIEFLHDMFDSVALDVNFNRQPIRTFFYDIETEISNDGFEEAYTARQRINMITLYDTLTEKYYTWSLEYVTSDFNDEYDENGNLVNECPIKDFPKDKFVIYHFHNDEKRMLRHFVNWWEDNYPDCLCGFNSQSFDLGYIINRVERVLGDSELVDNEYRNEDGRKVKPSEITRRLSPMGKISIKENNLENERANKEAKFIYDLDGIFHCDELVLYRDKYKIHQPLDGGNSLDNIGEVEVGVHKVHYKGTKAPNGERIDSLKDLYEKDFQRFYKYNVMDVEVLKRVEDKLKLIPLTRLITSAGLNNYNTIYSSISYLIGSLAMFSRTQMNREMVTCSFDKKNKDSKFEGAFVFEPIVGLYTNGVMTLDFESLYPNTIKSMNISPETTLGHLSNDWFAYTDDEHPEFSDVTDFTMKVKNQKLFKNIIKMMIKDCAEKNNVDLNDKDSLVKISLDNNIPLKISNNIHITRDQINKMLEKYCMITRNNDIICRHEVKTGVVTAWCTYFFDYRKKYKKEMKRLDNMLYNNEITDSDEINETKIKIENFNNVQQSTKIRLNSIFGILGAAFSPIFDVDLAQSITKQGKLANRCSSLFLKNFYHTTYGTTDSYIHTISGDTDSCVSECRVTISRK